MASLLSTTINSVLTLTSEITLSKNNARNVQIKGAGGSDCGIVGIGSGDQFAFQVYGSGGGDYGFLGSTWGGWDLRKTIGGSLFLNANTTYYLNPASTTNLNNLSVNGTFSDGGYTAFPLRQYAIDLSAQSSSNFYPVAIDVSPGTDATWHHTFSVDMVNQGGGAAYNMHSMYGEVRGQGWTDQAYFHRIFHNFYDSAERSILGLWRGTQTFYGIVAYLRGGKVYYVRTTSRSVTGYTSAATIGSSVYAIKNSSGTDVSGTSANIAEMLNLINNPSGFYHSDNAYIGTNQVLHLGTTSAPNLSIGGSAGSVTALGVKTGALDANIVTFAKMQQVTGPVAIGRVTASLGDMTTLSGADLATIIGTNTITNATNATTAASCSGNAASATTTDNINGRAFYNRDSGNVLGQDSYTNNGIGYVNGVSLYGQSDGGMYASAYSSSWIHQIYGDFRTGQIAIRGKNNGTWQAWRRVLDETNASYAWAMNQGVGTSNSPSFVGLTVTNAINGSVTGNVGTVTNGLYTSSTLTAGNLSGTIPSSVLGNSTHYIGTTAIALNRASGSQTLTGTSIDGNAGTVTDGVYASTTQSISGVKTFSSAPVATNIAKAWVHFNGTSSVGVNCTVNASYNVSSVAHNATGDYTVNFSSALVDASYAVAGTVTIDYTAGTSLNQLVLSVPRQTNAQAAGSCRLACEYIHGAQLYDSVAVRAVFFR